LKQNRFSILYEPVSERRSGEKTQTGIETVSAASMTSLRGGVAAGRKPRPGLKLNQRFAEPNGSLLSQRGENPDRD